MAKIVADRVLETSTTTGTGSYTLAGAVTGFRAASAVCANNDTFDYYAEEVDANGVPSGGWETGLGTWGTGNILARTTILTSSNAGAAVSWSAGTRRIALGAIANSMVTKTGAETLTNKTLSDYLETVYAPSAGSSFTVSLSDGPIQKFTTNANCTITLPSAVAGKGVVIIVAYGGAHTLTFAGGTSLKWPNGNVAPTPTSVNGKEDWYAFSCADTSSTRGFDMGRNI